MIPTEQIYLMVGVPLVFNILSTGLLTVLILLARDSLNDRLNDVRHELLAMMKHILDKLEELDTRLTKLEEGD